MQSYIYQPLSSGSKGNLTFLSSKDTQILIDCGLSCKHVLERLATANIDPQYIDAIILTHEHVDHIRGLEVFCKKFQTPVLCTNALAFYLKNERGLDLNYKVFSKDEPFYYGSIHIDPFGISHDAVDPVAFVFTLHGLRIGHCTDLGFVSSIVASKLQGCDVLLLESNHDVGMVHSSLRPQVYKKRVLSRIGHLSNEASAELTEHLCHKKLKRLYLGHLSQECNNPEKAISIHKNALSHHNVDMEIIIAEQSMITKPFNFSKIDFEPIEGNADIALNI